VEDQEMIIVVYVDLGSQVHRAFAVFNIKGMKMIVIL
jgi:hypothetical protein